jgi:TPR repeat protein
MRRPQEHEMRRYLVSILAVFSLAFSAAIAAGNYQDGRSAYDVGDFEKALAVWAPAADSGDADSQYGMGLLYSEGIVVPMDDNEALKWFGLAAEQGHGDAQYKLGVMHANGWGVPMDETEAMKWYKLAAENGVTAAQVSLGTMYQNGFSVEQDKVEALKWFSVAVKLGDNDARVHQEYLAERMPPEELARADADVNAWFSDHQTMLAESR